MCRGLPYSLSYKLGECFFFCSIFLYFSLCLLKDWRKFVIRIECTDQQCVMLPTVHLRVSVMTQRWTVRAQLLILHRCSKRPLAGPSIIHSLIHLFTSWWHQSTYPSPSYPLLSPPTTPPQLHPSSGCFSKEQCSVDWSVYFNGITLSIAEVLSLTKSDCFRLRLGDQDLSGPSETMLTRWAINYSTPAPPYCF